MASRPAKAGRSRGAEEAPPETLAEEALSEEALSDAQRLHGLIGRPVGDGRSLLTLADLGAVREPLAALLIELPQREIGGRLPA